MKHDIFRLPHLAIIGMVLATGCDNTSGPLPGIPDETDGRITVTNDPDVLDDRITQRDDFVNIDTNVVRKSGRVLTLSLKLVAEVSPPVVGGLTVQATSVSMNGGFGYISYNAQGATYKGAVDVIQLKGKSGSKTDIRSSASFADTDINAVYYSADYVYTAEASYTVATDPVTAWAERISTAGGDKFSLTGAIRQPLQSFVATSVYAEPGNVYVTTGNTGYLYRLADSTMVVQDSVSLSDARWVHGDGTQLVVMQGTPGRLSVRNKTTLAEIASYSFSGATIAESKSTVQVIGGKALVAAGDGGVKLINLATGTEVGSLPRVTVSGLDPAVTVTNAVAGSGQYIFVSNGEAGVYVVLASQSLDNLSGDTPITLITLGKLQFGSLQSVNHVAYDGVSLIIASGTGGAKIVEVTF